jgi:TfoX/Sxy family transcriptional regulator of competence genes
MKMSRAPDELVEQFYRVLPEDPLVERRKMFGFPCCFANGVMFAGLFEDRMVLKLPDAELKAFLALPDAGPFVPMGRLMKQYALVPRALLAEPAKMEPWMTKAFVFAMESGAEKKAKGAAPKAPGAAKKEATTRKAGGSAVAAAGRAEPEKVAARPARPAAPASAAKKPAAKQDGRAG